MKLLFDENLSPSLAARLRDVFPQSTHVREVGLKGRDDLKIWEYAAAHGFALVTKDDDFRERAVLQGAPPKLVQITLGNCPTSAIEALLRQHVTELMAFDATAPASVIELPH